MSYDFSRLFRSLPRDERDCEWDASQRHVLPLRELALRRITSTCGAFAADASVADLLDVATSMAEGWPRDGLRLALPRMPHRLLLACRACGDSPQAHALKLLANEAVTDAAIRREEHEYREKRASAPPDDATLAATAAGAFPLIDVFSEWHRIICSSEAPSLPPEQILFAAEPTPLGSAVLEPSLPHFLDNFDTFSCGLLRGLRWDGLVAAGGAVLACVQRTGCEAWGAPGSEEVEDMRRVYFQPDSGTAASKERYSRRPAPLQPAADADSPHSPFATSSDVDLFLVGVAAEEALQKLQEVARVVKRNFSGGKVLCIRSETAITFAAGFPLRNIQVVLKRFASPTDVLASFDVDCCGFAFDGDRVLATARAVRSVASKVNHVDLARRSQTYETRLLKYARRGFGIGLDASLYRPSHVDKARLELEALARAAARLTQSHWGANGRAEVSDGSSKAQRWGLARLLSAELRLLRVERAHRSQTYHDGSLSVTGPPLHLQSLLEACNRTRSHGELPDESSFHHAFGSNGTTGDDWFNFREAKLAADAEPRPAAGMRPALYTQGCVPWRHGFDAPRIEAYLEKARLQGLNQADFFDDPAIKGTLCVVRSSTLPSEAARSWGYAAGKLVSVSSFSQAATCISFFPRSPEGFCDGAHTELAEAPPVHFSLLYTPPPAAANVLDISRVRRWRYNVPPKKQLEELRAHCVGRICLLGRRETSHTVDDVLRDGRVDGSRLAEVLNVEVKPAPDPNPRHARPSLTYTLRLLSGETCGGDEEKIVADASRLHDTYILLHAINFLADAEIVPRKLVSSKLRLGVAKEAGWYWMHDFGGPPAPYLQRGVYLRSSMTSAEKARAEAAVALLEADTFLAAVGINASSLLTIKEVAGAEVPEGGGGRAVLGFGVGDEAVITDLVKAPGWNGLRCTVVGPFSGGRYPVCLRHAGVVKNMRVRLENLVRADGGLR